MLDDADVVGRDRVVRDERVSAAIASNCYDTARVLLLLFERCFSQAKTSATLLAMRQQQD